MDRGNDQGRQDDHVPRILFRDIVGDGDGGDDDDDDDYDDDYDRCESIDGDDDVGDDDVYFGGDDEVDVGGSDGIDGDDAADEDAQSNYERARSIFLQTHRGVGVARRNVTQEEKEEGGPDPYAPAPRINRHPPEVAPVPPFNPEEAGDDDDEVQVEAVDARVEPVAAEADARAEEPVATEADARAEPIVGRSPVADARGEPVVGRSPLFIDRFECIMSQEPPMHPVLFNVPNENGVFSEQVFEYSWIHWWIAVQGTARSKFEVKHPTTGDWISRAHGVGALRDVSPELAGIIRTERIRIGLPVTGNEPTAEQEALFQRTMRNTREQ
jgi:hypothetical protein